MRPERSWCLFLAALALSAPAAAMNWKATTRADHDSLDCVSRRLEIAAGATSEGSQVHRIIDGARNHVTPMLARHGGPVGWGSIELGSEDEAALICAQYGHANSQANAGDIVNEIKMGIWHWIKRRIWAFVMGCVPWIPLVAVLWWKRKKILAVFQEREQELRTTFRVIEEAIPDPKVRREKFSDPVIDRAYQREKPRLK